MNIAYGIACWLLVLGNLVGAEDPFTWVPPASPAQSSNLLNDDTYFKRLTKWKRLVDLETLRASKKPTAGLTVTGVYPDGPAEQFGIRVGDVMTELNLQSLRFVPDYERLRGEQGGPMAMWSPRFGNYLIKVPAPPGRLFFTFDGPAWYPELGYLRAGSCSDKWDVEAVAACLAFRQDPDFAVTALARVQAAGYQGTYLRAVQLCANTYRGYFRDALTGGVEAIAALPETDRAEATRNLYVAALRSFNLPLAKAMLERFPETGIQAAGFEPYLAAHQQTNPKGWMLPWPRPEGEPTYNLADMVTGAVSGGGDKTDMIHELVTGQKGVNLKAEPGYCAQLRIDIPPVETLEVFMDVSLRSVGDITKREAFVVAIGSPTLKPMFNTNEMPFIVAFNLRNQCAVGLPGLPLVWAPIPFNDNDPGRVRMRFIVEHDQVTARLNGHVLAHMPVHDLDKPWSLHFGSKYLFAQIHTVRLTARGKTPPPNWTPPAVAAGPQSDSEPPPESANDF